MGIENRDYVRGGGGGSYIGSMNSARHGGYSAVTWIIIITVVVFFLQLLVTRSRIPDEFVQEQRQRLEAEGRLDQIPPTRRDAYTRKLLEQQFAGSRERVVTEWFKLETDKATRGGQVWRFVTYAFLHDTRSGFPAHLLFNMLGLFFFGPTIERMVGKREFVVFYLAAAILAGLAFVLLNLALRQGGAAVGASGSVMAVLMVFGWHFPRQQILIYGIVPVQMRWLILAYVIYDTLPVLKMLSGGVSTTGVAHAAHLGGLAFGFLYTTQQWRLSGWLSGLPKIKRPQRKKKNPNLKVYAPTESLDDQVDAILQKIHEQGEESLTDNERETLKRASQRLRDRS